MATVLMLDATGIQPARSWGGPRTAVMLEDVLVYAGTVTFAVAGGLTGVRERFDLVGVLIVAAVTAVGGGSIRDVMAGIVPPTSLTDEPLLWAVFLTGFAVFVLHPYIPTGRTLYVADTISLGIFAALGAERGLDVGFGFWGVVFAGAISGIGGGAIRDVLTGAVPGILYRSGDLYAVAAAAGAAVTFALNQFGTTFAVVAGVVVTVGTRAGSRLAGLELPVPRTDS